MDSHDIESLTNGLKFEGIESLYTKILEIRSVLPEDIPELDYKLDELESFIIFIQKKFELKDKETEKYLTDMNKLKENCLNVMMLLEESNSKLLKTKTEFLAEIQKHKILADENQKLRFLIMELKSEYDENNRNFERKIKTYETDLDVSKTTENLDLENEIFELNAKIFGQNEEIRSLKAHNEALESEVRSLRKQETSLE